MSPFIEIKRFVAIDLLKQVTEILEEHQVEYKIEDTRAVFDITFTNSQMNIEYILKVREDDFQAVHELLNENFASDLEVDEYFMDSFTDEEVLEVISNPDEWNEFDMAYARKLASKRGIQIDEPAIEHSKEQRAEELKEGKDAKPVVIFCGYLFTLLGGWIGLIVAISLRCSKREVSPDNKVYNYSKRSRWHGGIMLFIFACWLIVEGVLCFIWFQ